MEILNQKLPSAFQPKDKVGLQTLIDLMETARDGEVTKVSFLPGKVKYDIQIPIKREIDADSTGFFRIANVDSTFVVKPFDNEYHYNSRRDEDHRVQNQGINEKQLVSFGNYLFSSHNIDRGVTHADITNFKETNQIPESVTLEGNSLTFGGVYTSKDLPAIDPDGLSDYVLIDLDGWRKNFGVGYYDFENKSWKLTGGDPREIDLDHMKWQNLNLNKER